MPRRPRELKPTRRRVELTSTISYTIPFYSVSGDELAKLVVTLSEKLQRLAQVGPAKELKQGYELTIHVEGDNNWLRVIDVTRREVHKWAKKHDVPVDLY